jgi:DNA invertase Pin-like site-specific DNA recombinase
MSINKAAGKRREATREERVRVIELRAQGEKFSDICTVMGISEDGAWRIWKDTID